MCPVCSFNQRARDSSSLERTKIPRRIVRFLVGFSIFWGSAHFCTLFAHRRESRVFPCIVCLTGVFTLQNGPVGGHSFAPWRCAARRHYKRPPAALVLDSVLFTPLGKFFIRALDVVAARRSDTTRPRGSQTKKEPAVRTQRAPPGSDLTSRTRWRGSRG